ncbi:n-carbamoyl-l-amino acid hydrolase [Fusarium mexicanum]|uniref:N-carbamoyl-l-amino acid hydrolase n=1 Tax=Fusarium mexicanum TaxID=751941 RepID=A0A8H5J502_9HYPO|nr:n-carbamoyl-l-amino acid hydrolase [Fusarium mexicanum]
MAPPEEKGFLSSLAGYYNTDALSDVTVTCGDQVFKAHKIILSAHSKCFAVALNGNWKEGSEGIIRIDDFDPDVVDAMLRFMYSLEYSNDHDTSRMIFDVRLYQIADKYDIAELKDEVKEQFQRAVGSGWNTSHFPIAANLVYMTTPSQDRGLRDIVFEAVSKNIKTLVGLDSFDELLRTTPDLAADLIPDLCGRIESPEPADECPECGALLW